MKFTPLQLKVLSSIQLRARAPLSKIAEELACSPDSVRRCIEILSDHGVIKPYTLVNTCSLGFSEHAVYFSYSSGSATERANLVTSLLRNPRVGTLAQFGGDYQYVTLVYVESPAELEAFLRSLGERHKGGLVERDIIIRLSWTAFNAKYLYRSRRGAHLLQYDFSEKRIRLDKLDHEILKQLSSDPLVQNQTLAKKIGVARSTIEYRLASLMKERVILGFGYWVDTAALGVQMFRFLIQMSRSTEALAHHLYTYAEENENIGGFVRSVGSWDFELRVEAREARTIGLIHQELLDRFGNDIRSIKVLTLFQNMKNIFYPLEDGQVPDERRRATAGR